MHEREVELAFSGQRVAAEGHGDLLHRDLEAGRRERLDKDVSRPTDSSKRRRAVGRHRMYQRQRRLVRAEERSDDAVAVAAGNRDCGTDYFARRLITRERRQRPRFRKERLEGPFPVQPRSRLVDCGNRVDVGGADGDGYSIYLTDPEGTVVELKSGN